MSIDEFNKAKKILDMLEEIFKMEKKALQDLEAAKDLTSLEQFRITYLGKKGLITYRRYWKQVKTCASLIVQCSELS